MNEKKDKNMKKAPHAENKENRKDNRTAVTTGETRRVFLKRGVLVGVGAGVAGAAGTRFVGGCSPSKKEEPEKIECPPCETKVAARPSGDPKVEKGEKGEVRARAFKKWPIAKPAEVHYARIKDGQPDKVWAQKIDELFKKLKPESLIKKDHLVALKQHFGEKGNKGHIKPELTKKVIDEIKRLGGKPMLVETNTLYKGSRTNTYDHIVTARNHGFSLEAIGAPVSILDGLTGQIQQAVAIPGKHFKVVFVASDVLFFKSLVALNHVKGHKLSGFGGALKNLAMGLASRAGKLAQHADFKPFIDSKKCIDCGDCAVWCPPGSLFMKKGKLQFNESTCIGCGQCLTVCPHDAIHNKSPRTETNAFMEKMAEYALGCVASFEGRTLYVNVVNHVSKACDCARGENPVVAPDVGIFAGSDPVAVDMASLEVSRKVWGEDHFKKLYPEVDGEVTIKHAEKIGLGTTKYNLVEA